MHLKIEPADLDAHALKIVQDVAVSLTPRTLAVRLRNLVNGEDPRTGFAKDGPLSYDDALESAARVLIEGEGAAA